MYTNIKRASQLNVETMRAALKQYDIPCRNSLQSWLSDEIYYNETVYSKGMSVELSSDNYTMSTHQSTCSSVLESLDDISNITGTGPSYVEKWLYKQPQSSTPGKNKPVPRDTHNGCTARRRLLTPDANVRLPPTSERPPCIGAELPEQHASFSLTHLTHNHLHNTILTTHEYEISERPPCIGAELPEQHASFSLIHLTHKHLHNTILTTHEYKTSEQQTTNESIQSDDTVFMEKPLFVLPITSRRKLHPLVKKLQQVRKTICRL